MTSGPEVSAVVAAQLQPVRGERLLDLFDRLLAKVRDRGELALGLGHEVADRLDADALQAVVRPDAELELLDGKFSMPCASDGSVVASAAATSPKPSILSMSVKIASWRM